MERALWLADGSGISGPNAEEKKPHKETRELPPKTDMRVGGTKETRIYKAEFQGEGAAQTRTLGTRTGVP